MTRGDTSGWAAVGSNQKVGENIHLHCMRQIAHEVFVTLSEKIPELREFAVPVQAPQV